MIFFFRQGLSEVMEGRGDALLWLSVTHTIRGNRVYVTTATRGALVAQSKDGQQQ